MSTRGVLRIALALLVVLATSGPVAAEPPVTTASTPTTVSAPATTAPAPPAAEATVAVGDEAAYRAALAALSADGSGPHTIDLTADITVDDGTDPTYTGTEALTIDGHGFTLAAAGTSRLLLMQSPADAGLTLADLKMTGGQVVGDGGAVLVENNSPVLITDSVFSGNEATGSGGALAVPFGAVAERSDFIGNVAATGDGGALDAATAGGEFVIDESQFLENQAPLGDGGAISGHGMVSPSSDTAIQRSTFAGNRAQRGGALVLSGGGVLANLSIVDNTATVAGGGIFADGRSLAAGIYLTLTGNAAPHGANVAQEGRELFLIFTVIAEPAGGGVNCAVGATDVNEVHADDDSCGGAGQNGGPAELGPLTYANGGRTPTRAPLAGSPLIDAIPRGYGFPSLPGGCAEFQSLDPWDQRGLERPQDGDGETRTQWAGGELIEVAADCDIGAVEARAFAAPPTGPVAAGPPFTG